MNHLYKRVSVALINTTLDKPYYSYGDHWLDGFLDAGCDVTVYPYETILDVPPRHDLYFFVEIRYNASQIPWYLTPRALYSWDSHVAGTQYYEWPATCFDKVLLASKIDAEALQAKGFKNVLWVPEACNPRVHRNMHIERTNPVGYVGCYNNSLLRNGKSKDDFVNHLSGEPYNLVRKIDIFGDDYALEQNKTQVMFDRTVAHNIGTRIFESCAAGCVPLWSKAGYNNGIEELLTENVHYVPYNDTFEDLDKVLKDLFNDKERMARIAKAAEEHVLAYHTYAHRVEQILDIMGIKAIKVDL
jgi:hypothetical protein